MEWEGLTNRLRAEIDELNNDKEKLLTDNKDLNSQLSENETSKELKERLESLDVENKLVKEQLNARETQLTSLQACSYFQKNFSKLEPLGGLSSLTRFKAIH